MDGVMPTPNSQAPALSAVHVDKPLAAANCLLAGLHAMLAAAAIAHRTLLLLSGGAGVSRHVAMVAADLVLLFLWALSQAPMLRPVSRAAFPDRLLATRRRRALPGVDVIVVTADPDKEPTVEVMNTVVSAMALDYPGGRLSVYLSDDAGSPPTLLAARKAYAFARSWVPFCKKYQVQCPCPERYFAGDDQDGGGGDRRELAEDRLRVKKAYEAFKEGIEEVKKKQQRLGMGVSAGAGTEAGGRQDHDAYVEIITDDDDDGNTEGHPAGDQDVETHMPLLVYVSREKRRASPHHFKAGALNALLRVSSLVSNSPYVLVLDCDMNCNSRSSALEAMCFHLHCTPPNKDLAFVQFPQMFHNLSANDIYANELRSIFSTRWKGLDGLRGPVLSGTGFYIRRDALYGATPAGTQGGEFCSMESRFGHSSHLVASVRDLHRSASSCNTVVRGGALLPQDAKLVASCAYEAGSGWGDQVGFLYHSVVEDYFTGYRQLFCRGWTSVYCYPAPASRPPFLGNMPTNLNDVLVQNKRWMSGLLAAGLSRHCPLTSRTALAVSVLQTMSFAYYAFAAVYAFPVLCYATLPQVCFFRGVPLFPKVGSSPWLAVYAAVFASSSLQHLMEVVVAKRRLAVRTWWNEQRFWMLNAVTGQLFACISVLLEQIGAGDVDFELTSKAADGKLYQDGVFDFTGCSTLAPGNHARRAQCRCAGRRILEDDQRRLVQRPVCAVLPYVLRCSIQLPAGGRDVPQAGRRKGSRRRHRTVRRLGCRDAFLVWVGQTILLGLQIFWVSLCTSYIQS
ncbi:LOW QUALITY PROTEIN: cellulose synthase A catalytic subunit 7 [UDP-forming]-like [Phragmites australis]|uniref:LOW QUALITY PROTEIN: cellulose synthase A catalytic subunit 7 [UDP-forming]-like n=1 Tax=Phragmites australis TaxID=29695 RepID=UPI002D76F862|nr:LOW QUALITY PROTEIN: cellulose synthase A catalytic subunit 7 [UDP-forming]-like [Phragmites australis]